MAASLRTPGFRILSALARFRYLSAFQLDRLLYGGCKKHVQNHAAIVTSEGYAKFDPLHTYHDVGGRPRRIYSLTPKGIALLKEAGVAVTYRNTRPPSDFTLLHSNDVNDVLILARQFVKQNPAYSIASFMTEYELKARPASGVSPDAAVLIEQKTKQFPLVFEIDRSTEQNQAFKAKIRGLVFYALEGHRQHLDSDYLTVAFVITKGGIKRLRDILSWTEQELTELGATSFIEEKIFLFGSFDPKEDKFNFDEADPSQFFLSPIWHAPSSRTRTTLLEEIPPQGS